MELMQKGVFDTRQFTLLRKQKLTFALVTQLIIFLKRVLKQQVEGALYRAVILYDHKRTGRYVIFNIKLIKICYLLH